MQGQQRSMEGVSKGREDDNMEGNKALPSSRGILGVAEEFLTRNSSPSRRDPPQRCQPQVERIFLPQSRDSPIF
jgi:hypothetical protein